MPEILSPEEDPQHSQNPTSYISKCRLRKPGTNVISKTKEHHFYEFYRYRNNSWFSIDSEKPKSRKTIDDAKWISHKLALDLKIIVEKCLTKFWREPN